MLETHISATRLRAHHALRVAMESDSDLNLADALATLVQIRRTHKVLGELSTQLSDFVAAEMTHLGIESIDTDMASFELVDSDTTVRLDNTAIAEVVIERLCEQEIKRNKKLPSGAVATIVRSVAWKIYEASGGKWAKSRLGALGIDPADYGQNVSTSRGVEMTMKDQ